MAADTREDRGGGGESAKFCPSIPLNVLHAIDDHDNHKLHPFVPVNATGQALKPEDERARRSHVRRVVVQNRKDRPLPDRLKFIDQVERWNSRTSRSSKFQKIIPMRSKSLQKRHTSTQHGNHHTDLAKNDTAPAVRTWRASFPQSPRCITTSHPFTHLALRHVQISSDRLDHVFKSDAFRTASEPLFDSSHVDANLNMGVVFPQCADEPVFFNALVYATVQVLHRGAMTTESLLLKGKTIQLLNEKLKEGGLYVSPAVIGSIMILKGAAYKFPDQNAHKTHTLGLDKTVKMCDAHNIDLTAAAKRAIFWIDVFGSMTFDTNSRQAHPFVPQVCCWRRQRSPGLSGLLTPAGFLRHSNTLPSVLLESISDTVELQELLRSDSMVKLPRHAKYHQVDTMQASIESRLALARSDCQQFGSVAEAVRLGVFVVCYCSWMDTWNSSLVPCRVGEQLLTMLESDDFLSPASLRGWYGHPPQADMTVWLLFVMSCVAEMDQGHVEGFRGRCLHLLQKITRVLQDHQPPLAAAATVWSSAMNNALTEFVYCDNWKEQRHSMKEWHKLELLISTSAIGQFGSNTPLPLRLETCLFSG